MTTHIDRYILQGTPMAPHIVFVFNDLHDWQSLAAAAPEGTEVVVLDGWGDGLAQMAAHLQGRSGIQAIHLLSHGAPGALLLGRLKLTHADIEDHALALTGIGAALADGGDILLYGCEVGANETGAEFVEALALATGADVAASTRPIGAAHLGGTWQLGRHHGLIEAASLTGLDAYAGVLAAPASENFDSVAVDGTGRSQGTTGAARPINDWTFSLLNAAGTLDSGSYVDVTRLTGDTSLANNTSDKAAFLNGTYTGGSSTQAAGVLKATSGEEFSFVSITVENGGGANTYRLVGYLNGSAVSGATQNFTAPAYGSNTVVSVSGSQWQYVDEVRIVQQNGAADISIYIDDIVVAAAVPPNAAPVNTTSGGTTAFTEGNNVTSTPVVIDSGITVTDADNSTLASGSVSITGNFQIGQDVLAFTNNPATMGNITGSYNSGTGIMSLSSSGATATLAQWQAALRSVTYTSSSETPNTGNRTISFQVNDGTVNSSAGTKTVSVAAVNDTPVATASGGTTAFTEGNNVTSTPVAVDTGITISDLDSSTLSTATVSITGNLHNAEDVLAFTNNPATMGNISGSYNSGTGVLSLSSAGSTATLAQWQAALRSVNYTNSSDAPNTSNRTISFVVSDGSTSSSTITKTVSVAAVNDTPVDSTSGGSTAFVQGNNAASTPVAVDSGFTVTDGDNSTLASATVAITGNFQSGEDELAFINNPATMGNISASYNAATGVLTLTSAGATATVAQWQNALRSVTYTDTAIAPNTVTRTISFTTHDGTADGNTATKSVTVTATNQTPIATASGGTTAFTEGVNVTSTPVLVDSAITLSDADSTTFASATASITANLHTAEDVLAFTNNPATMGNISASYNSGTGVLSLSSAGATATKAQWQAALQSVTYTNSSDNPNTANRTVSFVVNDGSTNSTATTKTVSVAAANDVPVNTSSGGNTAFVTGDNAPSTPVAVDSGFTVTDGDNATLASATVAVTGNFQSGEDELAFTNNPATMGNISASYNAATGVLTLTSAGATATSAQWQSALRSVTYTDTSTTPNAANRTISFTTNDGTANGNTATKIVTVAATNQTPIATASGGTTAFTEGVNVTSTPVVVDSGITVTDANNATLASATVSITGGLQTSEDQLAFTNNPATMGNIAASYNSSTGILSLSSAGATATKAQWQAALQSVTYTNSSDSPNTGNRTVSFVVNDGSTDSTATTKTVSVAAANDVPVNTTSGGSTGFTAGSSGSNPPVAVDNGFTVTDGDNATLASATVAITGGFQNGEDELAFTNNPATMGNISASYNAATGVLTLSSAGATATTAQWQNALRSVTYTDTSTAPNATNRTISFTTNDGTSDGNTASKLIAMNVDITNPTVTSVTSTTANGSYAGGNVVVQVVFSEAVTVTGTPQLTLETGAVDRVASYTGGSTTNTLTFTYSIQPGDNSADLDFQSTTALGLAGGTIKDAAGNTATLTLMAPGSPGSLGANKAIVIDTLAPTLASSMPLDNATGVSASSNLTLTFSENVTAAEGLVTLRKTSDNSLVEQFNVTNGEGSLGGTVSISGSTLTLNPHGDLAYNTDYYLLADFGIVKDGVGNYFDEIISPTALNFTTGSAPAPGDGGTPPSTTVDGVPVTTQPGPGGSTVTTIPVVTPSRPDAPGTPTPLADIPLITGSGGRPIVSVSVPAGVGLQAEGLTTTTMGSAALAELGFRIERIAGDSPELTNAGQVFYATLAPNEPLSVQILKPTIGAGYDGSQPLVINGSSNPADGKQAVIVDARALPAGTVIQVDNIEFIAVVGAVRIIGGVGQNAASGDGAAQWIVLGPDDDIIHGGGGNDVVGSEAGDDQVYGDAGDDIVFGGAGNDLLSGGTGSDKLNGGTGFDVAIQEGARTDYTVTLDGAGIKLTHTASGVSDWLVDVEQVRFATGPSLTVAHSAAEEAGAYLFQKWLGRDLNQGEGAIIQSLTGKSALEVATLFAQFFPTQTAGKTAAQLLEGMASAGAIRVDAIREVTVTGDAGNNAISPTLGLARYVDGGAGIDTVVLPATLAQTHIQAQGNGNFTLQRMTDGAMLDVTRVERVSFSDTRLALDLNGNAGQAAKLLGALAGPGMLANKGVVGEVIRLLDAGATSQSIAGLGLQLLGASTPTQVAQTLWTNVVGRAGTDSELKILTDILAGGVSAAELVVLAANLEANAVRIDLVGLTAKGIEFA